jgi:hypothetical protein
MAQARIHAGPRDEARRWCEEALVVARAVGSAEVEADTLVSLGIIEQHDDPAKARSLYAAGRHERLTPATWRSSCGRC